MVNIILISLLFLCIAFVFSMLGMGGSQLYIPILFWMGLDFKTEAIPLGIFLNLLNTLSSSITYARKKMIDWKIALPFAFMMIIFASLGAYIGSSLDTQLLIFIFAIFTMIASIIMLVGWQPKTVKEGKTFTTKKKIFFGFGAGSLLGLITGMIGRGGGSFIVPILYTVGVEPQFAVATSAFIVSCSGLSALITRSLMGFKPMLLLWLSCSISIIVGSQLGSHYMVKKIHPKKVKTIFGVVLLILSLLLLFQVGVSVYLNN